MNDSTINADVTMMDEGQALLANRYRVVKPLGQGGMGSVWLAEDTKLDGHRVAIKMLPAILVSNKRAYAQVKQEALVSLKLSHPHIVSVRAFEEDERGNPFLVMDYVDGRTLDDLLAEKGKLSEEETLRLLTPIAAALDYAHTQGVVHRDVKPGNVMIRSDGHPFVLDFGIAREVQETLTRVTGKLSSGTLLYMSPEQLNGDAPKPAQDVYSFAAMVYECLVGNPPFFRGAIEDQIKNKPPEPIGPHFIKCGLVMAGLSKDPACRPQRCADVLRAGRLPVSRQLRPLSVGPKVSTYAGRHRPSRLMAIGIPLLVLLGFVASVAVDFLSARIYEAKATLAIERRGTVPEASSSTSAPETASPRPYTFSARLSTWRTEEVVSRALQVFRRECATPERSDEMLSERLRCARLELDPISQVVTIFVRGKDPGLCAALADAYAEAIRLTVEEENRTKADKTVAEIRVRIGERRAEVDRISKRMLDCRTENDVEGLRGRHETLGQVLKSTMAQIIDLETEQTKLEEREKLLASVCKDPKSFGALSANAAFAEEIVLGYKAYQESEMKLQQLRAFFTDNHPEVVRQIKSVGMSRELFLDSVAREVETDRAKLKAMQGQLAHAKARVDESKAERSSVAGRIAQAEAALAALEGDLTRANKALEDLCLEENKAMVEMALRQESVRLGLRAAVPTEPMWPNLLLIYCCGLGGALVLSLALIVMRKLCR